jgi:hypothetical protein
MTTKYIVVRFHFVRFVKHISRPHENHGFILHNINPCEHRL